MVTRRSRCLTMALATASGLLLGGSRGGVALADAPVTMYQVTDQGVAVPAPPTTAPSSAPGPARIARPHGTRAVGATAGAGAPQTPSAVAPEGGDGGGSTLLANRNGVSSLDSQVTNFNATFEPPDQALCEGNGFVLEAVNSAYRIYRTGGATIVGPLNVNDLFGEGPQEFTTDPRCHHDPATHAWFAEITFISADQASSHLDVAVSTTDDPTGAWRLYRIDTTDTSGSGCPCFGDQPRIGIDQDNVYLSTDERSLLGSQFNGPQIYAISTSDLVSGRPAHFAHFGNLALGGTLPVAVEPALSTGTPDAEYFLNAFDPTGTVDNRLGVWAMTDRARITTGHAPRLSAMVISSEAYGLPVAAPQQGATRMLNPGDDRMQQTQYVAGDVLGELSTAATTPRDSTVRDGAAWFRVHPTLTDNHVGRATVSAQGYVASSTSYLLYPAMQADAWGRAAMVFTQTDPTRFPSAAYAVMSTGRSQFGQVNLAAAGTGPYDPNSFSWGDYSWAVLDPASDRFWMATEYVPELSSQTTTGHRNWGTRVLEVGVG